MLTVIAEIICHSEQDFTTVLDSFNNIREQVLKEPGCHLYDVHIDQIYEEDVLMGYSILLMDLTDEEKHKQMIHFQDDKL
jgi:hypothetical protein